LDSAELDNVHESFQVSQYITPNATADYYFNHDMINKAMDFVSIAGSSQGNSQLFVIVMARKYSDTQFHMRITAGNALTTGTVIFNVVLCRI